MAPFWSKVCAALELLTAAAQCRAVLPAEKTNHSHTDQHNIHHFVNENSSQCKSDPLINKLVSDLRTTYKYYCKDRRVDLPHSSVMLMSASDLMRSSTIPSTAIRTARINGVVPSWDLAFRFVERFLSKICKEGDYTCENQ